MAFLKLHSGGVVRNGAGLLLTGTNGAGKSTLVTHLLREGFSFLSDDVIQLDADSCTAHPSARPIYLRPPAWELFGDLRRFFTYVDSDVIRFKPEDLRETCRAEPTPVRCIVLMEPTLAGTPQLVSIGQAEAINALLSQCMNFPDLSGRGLDMLARLVRSARLYRLVKGDIQACGQFLKAVLP